MAPRTKEDYQQLDDEDLIFWYNLNSKAVETYNEGRRGKPISANIPGSGTYFIPPGGPSKRRLLKKKYDEEHHQVRDEILTQYRLASEVMDSRGLLQKIGSGLIGVAPLKTSMDTLTKHHLVSIIHGVNKVLHKINKPRIAVSGTKDVLKKGLNKDITISEHRESFISMLNKLEKNVSDKDLENHARSWYDALRGRICPECEQGIMADDGDKKRCRRCGVII